VHVANDVDVAGRKFMTPSATNNTHTGRCNCGKINYIARNLKDIWYCHCEQCRRTTGHHMAAAQVQLCDIQIKGEPKWYYVSEDSRYGFCPDCGSQIFWRNDTLDRMSVTGGSLDDASGIGLKGHIFTGEKAPYYELDDNELKYLASWK